MERDPVSVTFEFDIHEAVMNKPASVGKDEILLDRMIKEPVTYIVLSRVYEEISTQKPGSGIISYVVRHVDPTAPGGGKLFKFSQDELMNKDTYMALVELYNKKREEQAPKVVYTAPNLFQGQQGVGIAHPSPGWFTITSNTSNTP